MKDQQLPKVGYELDIDIDNYNERDKKSYYIDRNQNSVRTEIDNRNYYVMQAVIPNDNATYTAYSLPVFSNSDVEYSYEGIGKLLEIKERRKNVDNIKDPDGILDIWIDFVDKMSKYVTFSITYLDSSGETISVQPIHTGPRFFNVYRIFSGDEGSIGWTDYVKIYFAMSFTPGYIRQTKMSKKGYSNDIDVINLFLGTANYNQKYGGGYEVELDANELQQLDSMKFEIIYN